MLFRHIIVLINANGKIPIIETEFELNRDLTLITSATSENCLHRARQGDLHCLPGQARTSFNNAPLKKYLREALIAPNIDRIALYLYLVRTINGLTNYIR
jgi:hypothetical protein